MPQQFRRTMSKLKDASETVPAEFRREFVTLAAKMRLFEQEIFFEPRILDTHRLRRRVPRPEQVDTTQNGGTYLSRSPQQPRRGWS